MNLQEAFIQSLEQQFPGIRSKRVLLAVSGGPDSMALLYLFAGVTKHITVAHCNFGLRGNESDADELFVKQHCGLLNIPFYTKRFDTTAYATQNSVSIQVAARELRYEWFEQLRAQHQLDFVATAHHLDDNVETVLMNMLRGSGMKGLSGIPTQNGTIIRPLLFADKEQLLHYLNEHNIAYRVDASNSSNKYTRNKLRNTILPQLSELNPQATTHIHLLSKHAQFAYSLIKEKTTQLATQFFSENKETIQLQYDVISMLPFAELYLYELIADYGFNPTQCELIHANFCAGKTGSRFLSEKYELIVDRQTLLITQVEAATASSPTVIIQKQPDQTITLHQTTYTITFIERSSIDTYQPGYLYLDADNLLFPLHCRVWKQGDAFKPLGSPGVKKVSDFLIDQKVNLKEKRHTYILESATGDIVALFNHRIDDHYKITPSTQTVLLIKRKGDQ